jgi:hypothetical protein
MRGKSEEQKAKSHKRKVWSETQVHIRAAGRRRGKWDEKEGGLGIEKGHTSIVHQAWLPTTGTTRVKQVLMLAWCEDIPSVLQAGRSI